MRDRAPRATVRATVHPCPGPRSRAGAPLATAYVRFHPPSEGRVDFPNKPFAGGKPLDDVAKERLAALPTRYEQLAARLNRLGIRPTRVFTQYFDSTRGSTGNFCDPLMSVVGGKIFSRSEAEWAYEGVLAPLNQEVAAATRTHGWTLVWGAAQRFRTHGYCSASPWIVGLVESLKGQHDKYGTLHANVRGHREIANLVLGQLRRAGVSR